jgi:hypothetical protein
VIQKAAVGGVNLPHSDTKDNSPADLGQDLADQGAGRTKHDGADQGSSDKVDPQATNDMTPLNSLPSAPPPKEKHRD